MFLMKKLKDCCESNVDEIPAIVEVVSLSAKGYVLELWDDGSVTWRKLKVLEHTKPEKERK